jgi:hypothetical protein
MKTNKQFLFGTMGFLGGAIGALSYDALVRSSSSSSSSLVFLVLRVAGWSATCGALITIGLSAAGEMYNRRPFALAVYRKALVAGAVAGAIAGAIAQAVYSMQTTPSFFKFVIFRSVCWGIMGALLGWRLSAVVPNLGTLRGVVAGAIGGAVGGLAFVGTTAVIPETLGRVLGVGILGAALGLAIVAVETLFREASLEILWAPNETTSVTLGPKPVYIGGGDDHVHVAGLPEHAAGVVYEEGKVQYIDARTGRRTDLRQGSKIQIGKIEAVVHAKRA